MGSDSKPVEWICEQCHHVNSTVTGPGGRPDWPGAVMGVAVLAFLSWVVWLLAQVVLS